MGIEFRNILLLYADLLRRAIKAEQFLEEAALLSSKGEKNIIDALLHQFKNKNERTSFIYHLLIGFNELIEITTENKQRKLSDEVLETLSRNYFLEYYSVNDLLRQISNDISFLVSIPSIPPEIHSIILDGLPPDVTKTKPVSIVYVPEGVPDYNIRDVGYAGSATIFIRIPYLSSQSPTSWVTICHEMAHAIESHHGVTKQIIERFFGNGLISRDIPADELEYVDNWLTEFVCDSLAVSMVGEAYLSEFVLWFLAWDPRVHLEMYMASGTHPQVWDRIALMEAQLAQITAGSKEEIIKYGRLFRNVLESYVKLTDKFDPRLGFAYSPDPARPTKALKLGPKMPHLAANERSWTDVRTEIFGHIFTTLKEVNIPMKIFQPSTIEPLSEKLKDGLIISSREIDGGNNQKIVNENLPRILELISSQPDIAARDFYALLVDIEEEATAGTEILAAAWLCRSMHHLDQFSLIMAREHNGLAAQWEGCAQFAKNFDYRVSKSIEVGRIMREWKRFRVS